MWLLLSIIFWAFWRRILGGWLGLPRAAIVVVGALAAVAPFPLEWGWVVGLLAAAFWTPGHQFGDTVSTWRWDSIDRGLLLRYGPIGLAWIAARRLPPNRFRLGSLVDGVFALAELGAGAIFGLIYWAIWFGWQTWVT